MNRTAEIRLAILRDLAHVPAGLLRREEDIRCRVQLQVVPSPSRAEIETELKEPINRFRIHGLLCFDGLSIAGKGQDSVKKSKMPPRFLGQHPREMIFTKGLD